MPERGGHRTIQRGERSDSFAIGSPMRNRASHFANEWSVRRSHNAANAAHVVSVPPVPMPAEIALPAVAPPELADYTALCA